jgi:putative membrane protein
VAGLIYVASMAVLYLTPLFALTLRHPMLHEALHAHFVLAGCLFMWPLVGLDPIHRRGSLHLRVGVLLFALGSHAALAKLIYAGWIGGGLATSLPTRDIHAGAQLMYYGGDLIDLALLVAFFAQWYTRGGRLLAREKRSLARAAAS